MIGICVCGTRFKQVGSKERLAGKGRGKFCSSKCYGASNRKPLDETKLRFLAFNGISGPKIAKEVGLSNSAVALAIRRLGLYDMWKEQRKI